MSPLLDRGHARGVNNKMSWIKSYLIIINQTLKMPKLEHLKEKVDQV